MPEERVVSGMAMLRLLSATVEIVAALLMVRSGKVADAIRINGVLGLVGPLVLASVTALGVIGLAGTGRLSPTRLATLAVAVLLILTSVRQR